MTETAWGTGQPFADEVAEWRRLGLGRSIEPERGGENRLDFTSNDYLGLASDPRMAAAAAEAADRYGTGGRASRLLGGGGRDRGAMVRGVERAAAQWLGAEDAILLPSGYQANVTLLPAIAGPGDVIVSDALNHASLIDAARQSRALLRVVPHGDVDAVRRALAGTRGARRRFVITESIFSMDGDLAPLAELAEVCAQEGAGLIVDEAHAAGVIGAEGRGGFAAADASSDALVARIVTGGKALGASGAFLAGSAPLVDLLVHRGRGFVFSTAVPPPIAGALEHAIERVRGADAERATLRARVQRIHAEISSGEPPAGAIIPIVLGDSQRAVDASTALQSDGIDVRAVRPPTVPKGTARLRVVCQAAHSAADVDQLLQALRDRSVTERRARVEVSTDAPRPIFIVGTDTDIGKTVVSAAVARALDARYWKPVQTGDDSDTKTVESLAPMSSQAGDASERAIAAPTYWLPLPASPHTAAKDAGVQIDAQRVMNDLPRHMTSAAPARLVVEFAGGLHVPLTDDFTQADWIARDRPEVVLVARSSLGTLNHTLLTIEALERRGVTPRLLVLVGPPHAANYATLSRAIDRVIELPTLDPLTSESLHTWAQASRLAELLSPST